MSNLVQDIRYALRNFRANPGFTIVALTILAVGVGASAAMFSVVDGVLLKPLPYSAPDRLVRIYGVWSQGNREGISPPDFFDYRSRTTAFEALGAESNYMPLLNISGSETPLQVRGRYVSAGFFKMLGVTPAVGREFLPREEVWKGPTVAILSNGLWMRMYGRDPSIVGRQITMNSALYTVVGVLPAFFDLDGASEIYLPEQQNIIEMRGFRSEIVLGRLKPGVTLRQAQSELDVVASDLEREHADLNKTWRTKALPLSEEVVKNARLGLLLLLGAVGLVVLIVAANVANLMLAQVSRRRTEIAVRLALGSSGWRLARQLLTESLALSFLGGGLGCGIAILCTALVRSLGPSSIPRLSGVQVDVRVLGFAFAISVLMGIFFGITPVFRAGSMGLADTLKAGSRSIGIGLGRAQSALIVVEVGLSLMLLVGAGLLLRSIAELQQVDPGFRTRNILTTRVALPFKKYNDDKKLAGFWHDVLPKVQNIPGVQDAGIVSELPLSGLNNPTPFQASTQEGKGYATYVRSVSTNYMTLMDIPLRSGRYLSAQDLNGRQPVVVINDVFEREVFGGRNPLGQHLKFMFDGPYEAVIVGVVGSVHHTSLATNPFREAYLPLDQSALVSYSLVVRTGADPRAFVSPVREAVWSVDRDQSLGPFQSMQEVIDTGLVQQRFRSFILALFSAMSVAISAIGLYGVLSYVVAQRSREIGIRMAVGASRGQILSLVLGQAIRLTAVGLLIGGAASLGATRLLRSLLFGVTAVDPITFVVSPVLLATIALLASCVPALRASRVDPILVLRNE